MKKILFAFLILTSCYAIGADVDNALLQKNLEAANTQIEVLKAQVEVMKSYQDNFLATVYWSLGGVITLAILLIGSNWFINIRNQDKEAELLQDKINNHLNEINTALTASFEEQKNEVNNNFSNESKKLRTEIEENILYKLATKERKLNHELSILKKDVLKIETDYWLRRGVYGNALRAQLNILISPIVLRTDLVVTYCFEDIEKILETIQSEGKYKSLTPIIVNEINSALKGYEESYSISTAKIKGLLSKLTST